MTGTTRHACGATAGRDRRNFMRSAVRMCAIGLMWLAALAPTRAQDKGVTTSDAWVRVPAAGSTETIAAMTIDNPSMYEFFVSSGSTDAAEAIQFRDAGRENAVIEYITCPPGEATYLDPKGVHVYLSGLKRPLKAGETVRFTFKTTNGVEFGVEATVKAE